MSERSKRYEYHYQNRIQFRIIARRTHVARGPVLKQIGAQGYELPIPHIPTFRTRRRLFVADARTGTLPGLPGSAICVQGFDDSQNSAIHMTYHILLCPSSIGEPRYPMLKVVVIFYVTNGKNGGSTTGVDSPWKQLGRLRSIPSWCLHLRSPLVSTDNQPFTGSPVYTQVPRIKRRSLG